MDISVGIDIATSVSIIGAALTYVIQAQKESDRRRSEYFVSELKELFSVLKQHRWKYANLLTGIAHGPAVGSTPDQIKTFFHDFRIKMHENNKELQFELLNLKQSILTVFAEEDEKKLVDALYNHTNGLLKLANSEGQEEEYIEQCFNHDEKLIAAMEGFSICLQKRLK